MKRQVIEGIRLIICNGDDRVMKLKSPAVGMGALVSDGDTFVFNKEGKITRGYSRNPVFYQGKVLKSRVLKDGNYSLRAEFSSDQDLDALQRQMVLEVVCLIGKIKVLNEY